ncbi:hypothetical protein TruAng_009944 [Truncatella angustata]|nr:hypothetical protein TruAng_009944 [Truncatella angustata]
MAPYLALSANALAATILGLVIAYGIKFYRVVHVDGKVGPDTVTRCLFIGDNGECEAVDVEHCFWSSQIMMIVLAVGGILVADFALWAYTLQKEYLDARVGNCPRTELLARLLGSEGARIEAEVEAEVEEEASGGSGTTSRRRERSSLPTTLLSALSCASALALFAPHKTTLKTLRPLTSYPATDYAMHFGEYMIPAQDINTALSEFLVESAAFTRDHAIQHIMSNGNESYNRGQSGGGRTYRIGDTSYEGPRTNGVGVNVASFNDYFLSSRGRRANLGSSPYFEHKFPVPQSGREAVAQNWMVAPDYKFDSLEARVYGTNIEVRCVYMTDEFLIQRTLGKFSGDREEVLGYVGRYDISSFNNRVDAKIVQTVDEKLKITPWTVEGLVGAPSSQFFFITDHNPDLRQSSDSATVLKCFYTGHELMTNIVARNGVLEIKDGKPRPGNIADRVRSKTMEAVMQALKNTNGTLSKAVADMRSAQVEEARRSGKTRDSDMARLMVQDVLGDLAQAYWSLVRQRVETSIGMQAFDGSPVGLTAYSHGRLHGTYTRLGGSGWGMIMPCLLLFLPIVALGRLLLLAIYGLTRPDSWQALPQYGEDDIDYVDTPPPVPPPKDDDDEPPPPYAVRLHDLQAEACQ